MTGGLQSPHGYATVNLWKSFDAEVESWRKTKTQDKKCKTETMKLTSACGLTT